MWFGDAVDGDAGDGDAVDGDAVDGDAVDGSGSDGSGSDGPDGDGQEPRQRFHVEVYVGPAEAERRLAAVVAAGGTIVDDTQAPGLTGVADADGNRGVLCVAHPPHPS